MSDDVLAWPYMLKSKILNFNTLAKVMHAMTYDKKICWNTWNQRTLQIFTVRNNENTTLLNSDDNQLVAVSPAQAAWLSRWLKIERVLSTEGPRMTQILGLGKSRVKRSKQLSFWLHRFLGSCRFITAILSSKSTINETGKFSDRL